MVHDSSILWIRLSVFSSSELFSSLALPPPRRPRDYSKRRKGNHMWLLITVSTCILAFVRIFRRNSTAGAGSGGQSGSFFLGESFKLVSTYPKVIVIVEGSCGWMNIWWCGGLGGRWREMQDDNQPIKQLFFLGECDCGCCTIRLKLDSKPRLDSTRLDTILLIDLRKFISLGLGS